MHAELFHNLSRPVHHSICHAASHFHVSPRPQLLWADDLGKIKLPQHRSRLPEFPYSLGTEQRKIYPVYPDVHDQNFQTLWPKLKFPRWRTLRRSVGWYGGQYDRQARMSDLEDDSKELSVPIDVAHGKRVLFLDARNVQSTTACYRNHRVEDEFEIHFPESPCMRDEDFEIAGGAFFCARNCTGKHLLAHSHTRHVWLIFDLLASGILVSMLIGF